jgi:hypothetical protein
VSREVDVEAWECDKTDLPEVTGPMAGWEVRNFKFVTEHDDSMAYQAEAF